jgi:DNA polymerase-3 subunit delta
MVAGAAGTAQRRLVSETVRREREAGYPLAARREGGEWKELLSAENCGGLFDTRRLVLVEEAQQLGKFPIGLESLLENPSSATHLLLVYDEDPKSVFPKEIHSRITWLRGEEIPRFGVARRRWAEERAAEMGVRLSVDAMGLLLESVEDPEELLSELEKLAVAADGRRIEVEEIRSLCFDEGEKALLSLLDGLCEAERGKVASALPHVKRRDLIPVIAALHNRFRLAFYRSVFKAPRLLKIAASALNARPYQERQAAEAAGHYGREKMALFLKQLCGINMGEKMGNRNGWIELELAILGLLASSRKVESDQRR